ncbi:MAG: type II secretion system protein GspL [Gammaproteobacteria bacterium]|nr:type II secretion system protein GspL [Gammaproteobacteria bacterium]
MPKLFLRLTSEPVMVEPDDQTEQDFAQELDLSVDWLVREDDGQVRGEGRTDARGLTEIIDTDAAWATDPANIVTLIPAEHVLNVNCTVPGRHVAQIRRALPYAVEEYLTADVETLHLAHGPIQRGQPVSCLLVQRDTLHAWLGALEAANIRPGFMVSDASLLPSGDSVVSVLFEDGAALIRTPDQTANVDLPLLPDVLSTIADGIELDPSLKLLNGTLSSIDQSQAGFALDRIEKVELGGSVLDYLAGQWSIAKPEINLLQGAFAPSKHRSGAADKWRSVAALAAAWALVALTVFVTEGFWANLRANEIQAEAFTLYRSVYPSESKVRNPYRQMRAKLGQVDDDAAGPGFHVLLGVLAAAMEQAAKGAQLRNVRYSDARTELTAEIWIAGFQRLDGLKDQLSERGVKVEITSAEQQDDRVRASLRLRYGT